MRACPRCGRTYEDDQQFCSKDGSTLTTLSGRHSRALTDTVVEPGTMVGNYRVMSVLGKGGMGIVYEAENTRLGRKVALKVLRRELAADPMTVQRFFHEARAAHTVGHENIVEVFDFVDEGDARAYVMERLEGHPLTTDLAAERPLPLGRTLKIARQVADALAAVHAKGIIHRDLKPDNVFLTTRRYESDFVKLFDFGVAKLIEESEHSQGLKTEAGMILGTPAYMSPEQLNGGKIDHRVDIYAFGVMLYQMVTGRRPFRGRTLPELMMKHVSEAPVPPTRIVPQLPRSLEALVLRCLEKDPARRPHDMHEVEVAIEAVTAELGDGPATDVALVPVELPPDDTDRISGPQSDVATLGKPNHAFRPALQPSTVPTGDSLAIDITAGGTLFDETPSPNTVSGLALTRPGPARGRPVLVAAGLMLVLVAAVAAWLATRPAPNSTPTTTPTTPTTATTATTPATATTAATATPTTTATATTTTATPTTATPATATPTTATPATTATTTTATPTATTPATPATTATTTTATPTATTPATATTTAATTPEATGAVTGAKAGKKPVAAKKQPPVKQPPKPRDTPIDPFAGGG